MTKQAIIQAIHQTKTQLSQLDPVTPEATHKLLTDLLVLLQQLILLTPEESLVDNGQVQEVAYYKNVWQALSHTQAKEGDQVAWAYGQAHQTNAAQKRHPALEKAFRALVAQVHLDTLIVGQL
ncbi:hypothetical protein GCM10028805_43160 [Spirosoma harenae]